MRGGEGEGESGGGGQKKKGWRGSKTPVVLLLQACQVSKDGSYQYGLGAVSSLSYDVSGSNPDLNIWVVKVTYKDGKNDRSFDEAITYDASISSPSMTFTGENPSKFYVSMSKCYSSHTCTHT